MTPPYAIGTPGPDFDFGEVLATFEDLDDQKRARMVLVVHGEVTPEMQAEAAKYGADVVSAATHPARVCLRCNGGPTVHDAVHGDQHCDDCVLDLWGCP